jgi:lipid-A-disaccharide synthase
MKYFFLVGEPSGDMHAANLAAELKKTDPAFQAQGFGGDRMQAQGINIRCGLERLSFMGFWEVVKNPGTIRENFILAKEAIQKFRPDVVVLVDYPGFNMRMAKWCKQNGFKTAYYILPQVWAWNEKRVYKLQAACDRLIGVLPFEKDFYDKHGVAMEFVGHPLLDGIPPEGGQGGVSPHIAYTSKKHIALLPGSRKQEITRLLPDMVAVAKKFQHETFTIAGISKIKDLYQVDLPGNVCMVWDDTYSVIKNSKAAIVCSGTATLETALFGVPQVVLYKTGLINAMIVKRVARVQFAALPNLIAGEKIVEELLQDDCTPDRIGAELKKLLLADGREMYSRVLAKIGEPGASARAAKIIYDLAG